MFYILDRNEYGGMCFTLYVALRNHQNAFITLSVSCNFPKKKMCQLQPISCNHEDSATIATNASYSNLFSFCSVHLCNVDLLSYKKIWSWNRSCLVPKSKVFVRNVHLHGVVLFSSWLIT